MTCVPGIQKQAIIVGFPSTQSLSVCWHVCSQTAPVLLQFLRGRQQRPEFTYPDPAGGPNKTVSFADILVASGVSVIKQCSKGRVIIPYTAGRTDATVADDTNLPSPNGVVEQKHFEIFQNIVSLLSCCTAASTGAAVVQLLCAACCHVAGAPATFLVQCYMWQHKCMYMHHLTYDSAPGRLHAVCKIKSMLLFSQRGLQRCSSLVTF
jgi:hypothetical protein